MLSLYLQKEPTTDHVTIKRNAAKGRFDVVAYRNEARTVIAARWPWYYSSKPRQNCKGVMFNCYRWNAIW